MFNNFIISYLEMCKIWLMNDLIETSKTVVVICKTTIVSGITISICTLVPFYTEIFCSFFFLHGQKYGQDYTYCLLQAFFMCILMFWLRLVVTPCYLFDGCPQRVSCTGSSPQKVTSGALESFCGRFLHMANNRGSSLPIMRYSTWCVSMVY